MYITRKINEKTRNSDINKKCIFVCHIDIILKINVLFILEILVCSNIVLDMYS